LLGINGASVGLLRLWDRCCCVYRVKQDQIFARKWDSHSGIQMN
jgi:hypothetical protein